ncbi:FAD binding domain-containing protein [Pseudooceanicola sp. C21-150M6]|uniref:FAD binding domain-containing protein n=1 Tax=Pseudooceanicola sp. C21-150M6 TaxID=3434355 RepID=UPI003D7FA643
MKTFDYSRPATLAEALSKGAEPGARYIAGGTNLMDLMKANVARPDKIIDISRLPELSGIDMAEDEGLRIGALVRNADMARDPRIARTYPALAEALLSGASPQLRNMATLGGNLMQSTRCPYFYDAHSACNRRDPGAGCDAIGGETHNQAVLGWSDQCIATHPSDMAVPLAALGAVVEIAGPEGQRDVPVMQFYALPDATSPGGPKLNQGEIVTGIHIPGGMEAFADHSRYLKLRERTSFAFALVSAAAMLRIAGGHITEARIALGGVAAAPWRVEEAEALLTGTTPGTEAFARAADILTAGAAPSGDNAHKIDLAKRIAVRALTLAAAGTPAEMPALPASVFAAETGEPAHA